MAPLLGISTILCILPTTHTQSHTLTHLLSLLSMALSSIVSYRISRTRGRVTSRVGLGDALGLVRCRLAPCLAHSDAPSQHLLPSLDLR